MRVAVVILVACAQPVAPDLRVEVVLVPTTANRNLDLLFVIDDSTSLLATQSAVVNTFPSLLEQLDVQGRPSLHIGVVSSDLGTLGALDVQPGPSIGSGPGSCSGDGKGGVLTASTLVPGRYIIDDNGTTNYLSSIAEAFTSIGSLGSSGCGFEQHLHAMKRALENNVENAGFLRPNAELAVIVFTDEDDCSFAHSSFVSTDISEYGSLGSFRCARFGITCDVGGTTPDAMNDVGLKSGCHANDTSDVLMHPSEYVRFLQELKADPRDVMFATLAGGPEPIEVVPQTPPGGGTAVPALANLCSALDAIGPSVRLSEMPTQFRRGSFETVCTTDMHPAMTSFGRQLRNLIGDACLARDIALPADCRAFDETLGTKQELLPCSPSIGTNCYQLVEDRACIAGQHLRVEVTRSMPPTPGTMVSLRCRV